MKAFHVSASFFLIAAVISCGQSPEDEKVDQAMEVLDANESFYVKKVDDLEEVVRGNKSFADGFHAGVMRAEELRAANQLADIKRIQFDHSIQTPYFDEDTGTLTITNYDGNFIRQLELIVAYRNYEVYQFQYTHLHLHSGDLIDQYEIHFERTMKLLKELNALELYLDSCVGTLHSDFLYLNRNNVIKHGDVEILVDRELEIGKVKEYLELVESLCKT